MRESGREEGVRDRKCTKRRGRKLPHQPHNTGTTTPVLHSTSPPHQYHLQQPHLHHHTRKHTLPKLTKWRLAVKLLMLELSATAGSAEKVILEVAERVKGDRELELKTVARDTRAMLRSSTVSSKLQQGVEGVVWCTEW